MFNSTMLRNKVILVTGASSGIGKQTAVEISKLGGKVILTSRKESKLRDTLALMDNREDHIIEVFDLSDYDRISEWLKGITAKHQVLLDGFVHSAGISKISPFHLVRRDDLDEIFSLNFYTGILLLKTAVSGKISKRGSSYVFISSVAGIISERGNLAYGASKAAVNSAVRTAALEVARFGHRVNCVAPGVIETELFQEIKKKLDEDQLNKLLAKFPLGFGQPSDVANASIFLLSDASRWITGTTLVVDGGYLSGK